MKFTRVIGKIDEKLVEQAEAKLSQLFMELGLNYINRQTGTGLGGDALIFSLMYPVEQICTLNIPTAATDGKRFYWNPKFVLKKSRLGLRLIAGHEAWHALYMHPSRRGSRLPKLWNIAVDYIVNNQVMDDLKARDKDPKDLFQKHLGKYMTLEQYAVLLKNPFKTQPGFEEVKPTPADPNAPQVDLPDPLEDRELTPEEIKELDRREKKEYFFFADPDLDEDWRRPERIYEYLYSLLPKCPDCGRIGFYQMPPKAGSQQAGGKGKKGKKGQGQGDQDQDQKQKGNGKGKGKGDQSQDAHDHGDGEPCNCPNHDPGQGQGQGQGDQDQNAQGNGGCNHDGCPTCGDGIDIFDLGGTVDDHMDTKENEEKLAKRISDAVESCKKMAGSVPAALEDELGKLTAPKITWQDIIRARLTKARSGNDRNDWTRFRSRPMFAGMMIPKRKSYFASFGCLLDTSGSMSKDDMAFGLSQLTALDDRSEGTIVPCDCQIYWQDSTKVKKCNAEQLQRTKVVGRGGTAFAPFFSDYEKNIGKCDFLIVITDAYLLDQDVAEMKNPGVDVFWLVTSGASFKPPFGRVLDLRG